MTVIEMLKLTEQILTSIRVPVALKESIADPVYQAAKNVSDCVKTIEENMAKEKMAKEAADDGGEAETE